MQGIARNPRARPLQVYAFDPTRGRTLGNHMTVSVPYEEFRPGPVGRRLAVVDFDASNGRYYTPVELHQRWSRRFLCLVPVDVV